jgi:hypothetical protein
MTSEKKIKDVDEIEYIYIKHRDNERVYKIPTSAAIHSKLLKETIIDDETAETHGKCEKTPLIIKTIDVFAVPFIVKYMEFYDGIPEKIAPESPLKDIHISIIFAKEYVLFNDIYEETDTLKEKISKLGLVINASHYFIFKHLHKKLCAIITSLIRDVDISMLRLD